MSRILQQGEDYQEETRRPRRSDAEEPIRPRRSSSEETSRPGRRNTEESMTAEEEAIVNGPEQDVSGGENQNKNKLILIAGLLVVLVLIVVILLFVVKLKTGNSEEVVDSSGDGQVDFNVLMEQAADGVSTNTVTTGATTTEETPAQETSNSEDLIISDEEADLLRSYGYTGDEIEFYRKYGLSYDVLIEEAEKSQQEVAEKRIEELSDTASDEYKRLLKLTWLSGKKLDVKEVVPDEYGDINITYETKIINGDYVKCGAQGTQLFIKVKMGDLGNAFMFVSPQRWVTMPEKGNIVVSADICHYGDVSVITNIYEVETGAETTAEE